MGSKIKLIFLVIILSIQPALAKDKVKKDSAKSAEDKVTLVCTLENSETYYMRGLPMGLAGGSQTIQVCSKCTLNGEHWQISSSQYSIKIWTEARDKFGPTFDLHEDRINRYTGELTREVKTYTKRDENSELLGTGRQSGTCKKMDAPVL